jgi:DeoR family fructose operon transcriptional repressor
VLVGPLAVAAFGQVQADAAILSCGGLTPDGITNSHSLLIDIQLAMIHSAQRVILCADHTKFGRQSITRLCGLDMIDTLITDEPPTPEMQAALEAASVELIVANAPAPPAQMPATPPAKEKTTSVSQAKPERPIQPALPRPAAPRSVARPASRKPQPFVVQPDEKGFID